MASGRLTGFLLAYAGVVTGAAGVVFGTSTVYAALMVALGLGFVFQGAALVRDDPGGSLRQVRAIDVVLAVLSGGMTAFVALAVFT